jgi:hypothetical protein
MHCNRANLPTALQISVKLKIIDIRQNFATNRKIEMRLDLSKEKVIARSGDGRLLCGARAGVHGSIETDEFV